MYDITRKTQFSTVGELKELLKTIPDETRMAITGDYDCWFHVDKNSSVVCLDVEELDEAYETDYPCDNGECPYDAQSGYDCRNYCGAGVDE